MIVGIRGSHCDKEYCFFPNISPPSFFLLPPYNDIILYNEASESKGKIEGLCEQQRQVRNAIWLVYLRVLVNSQRVNDAQCPVKSVLVSFLRLCEEFQSQPPWINIESMLPFFPRTLRLTVEHINQTIPHATGRRLFLSFLFFYTRLRYLSLFLSSEYFLFTILREGIFKSNCVAFFFFFVFLLKRPDTPPSASLFFLIFYFSFFIFILDHSWRFSFFSPSIPFF